MRIVALAGGIGGARFLRGLLAHLDDVRGPHEVTVIGNTADDISLFGLHVSPDLDTLMYTLGGGIHEEQGWGRDEETFVVLSELSAYGVEPRWFALGDRDIATHLARTAMLAAGQPLSAATSALCRRWLDPGRRHSLRLLPMSDDRVETHVWLDSTPSGGASTASSAAEQGERRVHFQEWWVALHAQVPARRFEFAGIESARPAPGVLEAIAAAEVILMPPSNPVVSIGPILAVPGVRSALGAARAPIVGVSPIINGSPVRGMADACLSAIGVATSAPAVAGLFADLLDGWLVDAADAGSTAEVRALGMRCRAVPLLMTDVAATAAMAADALDLAGAGKTAALDAR